MQQIKLKGFSSWGGKNAQNCRYSTRVAEMLQKKLHVFFYPFYRTFKPHWNDQKKKGSRKRFKP